MDLWYGSETVPQPDVFPAQHRAFPALVLGFFFFDKLRFSDKNYLRDS